MKRPLRPESATRVTVLIIAVGIGGVSASEQQAQISVQNSAEKRPIVLVQNAAQKVPGNRRAKANVDAKGVILKGYDVVAYVNEGKAVKGSPEIKSSVQGVIYLFAHPENKAEFDKDPSKYAPQYGGFCAYGVALGVLADIEDRPEAFAVSNGKLYVCSSAGSLRKFRADIDKNIEKADKQWLRISAL